MTLFPTYDPEKHLAQVQKQWASYNFNNIKACQWNTEGIHKYFNATIRLPVDDIFYADLIYMPAKPAMAGREHLTRLQHQLCEERIDSANGVIATIFHYVKMPAGKSSMSVPLYTLIPDFPRFVTELMGAINGAEYKGHKTFPVLNAKLRENTLYVSGIDPNKHSTRPVVLPVDYDGNPLDYLRNTPFYDFFKQPAPFTVPRDLWTRHAFFAAPSGYGKSQLAGGFLREALEDPEPRALIVIDPHGKKEKSLFEFAVPRVPPERLVVIDPDVDPPDVGLLDFGVLDKHAALETFLFLMSSMAGGLSPKQETSIPSLFELLSLIPDANLLTLQELITERPSRGRPSKYDTYIGQLDDVHQDFFRHLWFGGEYEETRKALQWKLLAAMGRPAFKKMFSAKRNSIDMDRFLRERKVVVINGGEKALGKDGMRIFLLFLIGQYYAAAKRRTSTDLAMCMVDEASYVYQSPIIADILAELRGYGCSFAGWTQHWAQVGTDVKPAILGNTAIKGVGPLAHDDASVIGREIFMSPAEIRSLKGYDGEGTKSQWAMFVAGMDRAQVVSVPYGVLAAMPRPRPPQREMPATPKPKPTVSPATPVPDAPAKTYEQAVKKFGLRLYDLVRDQLGLTDEEKKKLDATREKDAAALVGMLHDATGPEPLTEEQKKTLSQMGQTMYAIDHPETHEAPARTGASRGHHRLPAEADKKSVPQEEAAERERKAAQRHPAAAPPEDNDPSKPVPD